MDEREDLQNIEDNINATSIDSSVEEQAKAPPIEIEKIKTEPFYPEYSEFPAQDVPEGLTYKAPKKEVPKKESKKPMYTGDSEKDKQKYINKIEKDASNTEFDWMKSNYEAHMLKKILTERNDPAPVLLEAPWSEWTPLN